MNFSKYLESNNVVVIMNGIRTQSEDSHAKLQVWSGILCRQLHLMIL